MEEEGDRNGRRKDEGEREREEDVRGWGDNLDIR